MGRKKGLSSESEARIKRRLYGIAVDGATISLATAASEPLILIQFTHNRDGDTVTTHFQPSRLPHGLRTCAFCRSPTPSSGISPCSEICLDCHIGGMGMGILDACVRRQQQDFWGKSPWSSAMEYIRAAGIKLKELV